MLCKMSNTTRFLFLLQFNLLLIMGTAQNHQKMVEFLSTSTASNAFVVFDPNVSILDMYNPFRYTITDQIPLVSQVATKFTKLFILLSEVDLRKESQTSLSQSALAVAEYNKLLLSSEKKLEVWLAYSTMSRGDQIYDHGFLYRKEPAKTIKILNSIAQQSNAIYNGTVTTILLPYKFLSNHVNPLISENRSLANQFWSVPRSGILFETDILYRYEHTEFRKCLSRLNPNVVIITLLPFAEVPQLIKDINFRVEQYKRVVGLKNGTSFGYIVSSPDTDLSGKVNVSKLVSTWHIANNWSKTTGHTVILAKAFDTPCEDATQRKTDGWWRLVENSEYKNSGDYRFEEKDAVVASAETSFIWLKGNISLSNDHVEVIFSMFDYSRAKNLQRFSEKEINVLLQNLVTNFKKVWMILHDDTGLGSTAFLYEVECLNLIREQVEVSLVILPNVSLQKVFKWNVTLDYVEKEASNYFQFLNSIKTYVTPFEENGTLSYIKNTYLNGRDMSLYNFGYMFNVTSCCSYLAKGNERELRAVQHILKVDNITTILFYFEEVPLGAVRMFQQRVVMIEQCRKLVEKWNLTPKVALKFMLLHYSTSTMFYRNRWEMVNFIEYWQKLSEWAEKKNVSVILSNAVDSQRYSPKLATRYQLREPYITELGWWRLQSGTEDVKKDSNMWINKIDDAILQFPDEKTSSQSVGLGTIQLTSIIFVSIAVVVIAVCVVKRNQKLVDALLMSSSEIEEFYNGVNMRRLDMKSVGCAYHLPYEKNQHEISSDAFTVDFNSKLGSGEFGMVCMARIQMPDEVVKVAVKTVNSSSFVNTARLKGFLSEIKLLAYIGKHEHITQMIGANTENLQFGKVYIFLEFCELGSLEKYLGKIKSSLEKEQEGPVNSETTLWDDRTKMYLELVSKKKSCLDFSVSEDLLRWSHEICKGMAYLASKHVVHADLATRNVLLSANKEAKICDFGLSRRMYNYTNYVKQQQEPLPWKWMAPESLQVREFSEKSDVWAYGITIWEIFSLAEDPYPGLTWTVKFASMLENGLRMDEPKYDNANMYWIMRECWSTKPQNRPSFSELLAIFD